jgi:hypothetical protein
MKAESYGKQLTLSVQLLYCGESRLMTCVEEDLIITRAKRCMAIKEHLLRCFTFTKDFYVR